MSEPNEDINAWSKVAEGIRREMERVERDMSEFQQRLDARDRNNRPPPKEPPVIVAETVVVEAKPIVTQSVTRSQPPIFPDSNGSGVSTTNTFWVVIAGVHVQYDFVSQPH